LRQDIQRRVDLVVGYRVHPGGVRTSEVAAQAHVNTQTLRYYERRGLLPAPKRTSSGYRAYTAASVRVVRFVKRAQQLGFTLRH
jgi:DNA-binding transcriptional MerR regulator